MGKQLGCTEGFLWSRYSSEELCETSTQGELGVTQGLLIQLVRVMEDLIDGAGKWLVDSIYRSG